GGGRVHLIDRPLAEGDKLTAPKGPAPEQPGGELVTLDAATGRELWRSKDDVFGTILIAGVRHDTLLMAYQPTSFKLPSEKGGRAGAGPGCDDGLPLQLSQPGLDRAAAPGLILLGLEGRRRQPLLVVEAALGVVRPCVLDHRGLAHLLAPDHHGGALDLRLR